MTAPVDRLADALRTKERLPRAWPVFFGRHGNFTAAQLAAIPALLDGQNVIISAATASGKTEAAFAPLIERYCPPRSRSVVHPAILYLTPTRALVNDQAARLSYPLRELGLTLGVKSGDLVTFGPRRAVDVIITTPESLDSLLTTQPRLLANLRAIVIDEIHLFDGTPRGDHLRVLLNRVRWVRSYAAERGDAPDAVMQYVALSATLHQPESVAARYFPAARSIVVEGRRAIEVDWVELAGESSAGLLDYLNTFAARGWRKALVFCNSRAEVEAFAAVVRKHSPFGGAVFVHYSNIESKRRREIEQQFAESEAAICFASNTLELGIDIGSIDIVLLIGPPGHPASFTQRVGRGNRRRNVTRVACLYRSRFEYLLFEALVEENRAQSVKPIPRSALCALRSPFRPAVAIQQIFSLLRQSPTGSVRLSELCQLFDAMLSSDDIEAILGELQELDYLKVGRPGEWRPGQRLNELFDEQGLPDCSLSVFGNVQSVAGRQVAIRDQHTGQTMARVDAQWLERPVLTLEGRAINVEWWDGEAMWITSHQGDETADRMLYRSTRQLLSYELARLLPARLGLPSGSAPFIATPTGWCWFHWLGDLYGRAFIDLLRYTVAATRSREEGLCLFVADEPRTVPGWLPEQITQYLEDNYHTFEPMLALGPFQRLLPIHLRRRSVVEQFDVAGFLQAVTDLQPLVAPENLAADLLDLVPEE